MAVGGSHAVLEGAARQIGFVVRDLDAAIKSWCALGVGPWFTIRELEQPGCRYRGEPCEPVISLALTNTGPMQVELIQPHGDGPSIYHEFLTTGREGFHQLAWWPTDFDATTRRAEAAGWTEVFAGRAGDTRFAYFEVDPATSTVVSTIVEITELNDTTQGLADLLEAAARDWDGVTDPVRSLL
jgi:hypothetical protein